MTVCLAPPVGAEVHGDKLWAGQQTFRNRAIEVVVARQASPPPGCPGALAPPVAASYVHKAPPVVAEVHCVELRQVPQIFRDGAAEVVVARTQDVQFAVAAVDRDWARETIVLMIQI